jgi:hypothetical protein
MASDDGTDVRDLLKALLVGVHERLERADVGR